ncbi:MAG: type II toxin-antitoxin system Phd/YefM family antitoxin [Planctomycetaceae bacterium]
MRVGIRSLKNNLSRYLEGVRAGENVVVTDRGRPIALIRAIPDAAGRSWDAHRDALAAEGLLARGRGAVVRVPRRLGRLALSRAVLRDREERG